VYIRDTNRSGRLSREGTIWPQVSLAMSAAMFPKDEVVLYDCIAERIDFDGLFKRMESFKPSWVVFIAVSTTVVHDTIVAHFGKRLGAQTVVISPHFEGMKDSAGKFPSIDHVINYDKHEEPEYELRRVIKGIHREATENFSTLPPARQDLLPLQRYDLPFIGQGYTFVVTSRGCPWKCIYCRQTVTWKSLVRYREPADIVEEIKRFKLRNVAFHADTATVNKPKMLEICRLMPKGTRWICNSRVDTVDLEMLKAMKKAGCWMIVFGCESGDDKVLAMNKKEATVADARRAVLDSKRAGLQVWGYFMLGMYGDTPETMEKTIQLSKALPFDIVNYAVSAPYPGTEWGDIAKQRGMLRDIKWEDYDQNYSAVVDQPGCPAKVVIQYQRRAYLQWYLSWRGIKFFAQGFRPRYFRFFLKAIKNHLS